MGKGASFLVIYSCKSTGADITAAATSLLASDAKYKKFAAQIDRCLQSFDSVNEWADFISFLSRLLKVRLTP